MKGGSTSAADRNNDDDDDSQTPTSGNASNTGSSTNPTEPATSGSCGSQTKLDACFECCEKEAGPAAIEVLQKAFGDCMCAPAKCGTQCAQSACADKEPAQGDACDTCIQAQFEACDQVAITACEGDATCKKLFTCEEAAKCSDKPE